MTPTLKEGEIMKSDKKEIDKAIKVEMKRLDNIFKSLDEDKRNVAEGLISEVAFMRVTLKGLKDDINENGAIDEMPQGEYSILRQSPSVQVYNAMIQRYNTIYKDLFSLLPKDEGVFVDDEFENF